MSTKVISRVKYVVLTYILITFAIGVFEAIGRFGNDQWPLPGHSFDRQEKMLITVCLGFVAVCLSAVFYWGVLCENVGLTVTYVLLLTAGLIVNCIGIDFNVFDLVWSIFGITLSFSYAMILKREQEKEIFQVLMA